MGETKVNQAQKAIDNLETSYATLLDDRGLVDTSLARIGFFAVARDLQLTKQWSQPEIDSEVQFAVLAHIEEAISAGVNDLRKSVREIIAMDPQ